MRHSNELFLIRIFLRSIFDTREKNITSNNNLINRQTYLLEKIVKYLKVMHDLCIEVVFFAHKREAHHLSTCCHLQWRRIWYNQHLVVFSLIS